MTVPPQIRRALPVAIRAIAMDDAAPVGRLCGELGYPATVPEIEERIRASMTLADHAVFVACLPENQVVGWIDVAIVHHLQAAPRAEIGGLVVSSQIRSLGVGRLLVAHAEAWARERGMTHMVVRSQIAREKAHRFYVREGYRQTKTSAVFSKNLV